MKQFVFTLLIASLFFTVTKSQSFFRRSRSATHWVDSVYRSLTPDQRIAQLIVMRESGLENNSPVIFAEKIKDVIRQYNIGAICLFQGTPQQQLQYVGQFQQLAKTPLMVCIDGETGLGMRMPEIMKLPDQLTMGAMRHADKLIYSIGKTIGEQCRSIGINVNYAPVVDINNNPNNPVIGYRSFGQNKYTVARYGIAIMKGIQRTGIMACAKHFPGHGDVDVDSHLDLPVIHKSLAQLDTLELYPFKKIFKAGVGSVMIAHLFIPAIDSTPHLASSLSPKFVTDLLRKKIGFRGISFTDALEMQGVAKYFPAGEVAVKSLIAGNDMLCLPEDIPSCIDKIDIALKDGRLNWGDIEQRVKKVLYAKYHIELKEPSLNTDTTNIVARLNQYIPALRKEVALRSLTAVKLANDHFSPIQKNQKTAYILIGGDTDNAISGRLEKEAHSKIFYFPFDTNKARAEEIVQQMKDQGFNRIFIGLHNFSKRPANNFGISNATMDFLGSLNASFPQATALVFGNPYAIKDVADFQNIIAVYEDDAIFQENAAQFLMGKRGARGVLPVSVTEDLPFGTGINVKARH